MGKWEMVKLGDVFPYVRNGASIKQEDNATGFPITRIETIADGSIDRSRMGYANINEIERYSDFVLETGDILMSHINSVKHLGKTALYLKKEDESIIHGMNLLNLRANPDVLSSIYAHRFFNSYYFKKQLPNITKNSVNQSSFNITALKELKIPLPPLEVQQKIANVLDRASALIEKRKAQIDKLDLLVKSQFIEIFGDPVTNPKGWDKDLWPSIFNAATGKIDSNAMVDNGKYPFFTCAKEAFWIDKYAFDCEALILAGNNAAGIYDVKHYAGKFNAYQRTYVLTLMDEKNQYCVFKIQLESKLEQLRHSSKGTNTKYLTMGILNNLEFIIPPSLLQTRFADFVQQVEAQKSLLQQSLAKLECNHKSLMQKCFAGEVF